MPSRRPIRWRHPSACRRDDVEQLARHAVRFRRVEGQPRRGIDDGPDQPGQLANREIFARADVDVLQAVVALHQEHAGVGEVVHVQELAPRRAGPPDHDVALAGDLRVVELPHQRRDDVRAGEVEVVVRTVEVRRHRGDEVVAVLLAVRLAQLDAGDLRDRVGLVRGLERAGQQLLLRHRLGAVARVDAGAAEIQQLLHAVLVRRVHHRGVNHHVVVDELGRPGGVRHDAADSKDQRRSKSDIMMPRIARYAEKMEREKEVFNDLKSVVVNTLEEYYKGELTEKERDGVTLILAIQKELLNVIGLHEALFTEKQNCSFQWEVLWNQLY